MVGCREVDCRWRSPRESVAVCVEWLFGKILMQNVCVGTGPRSDKGISGSKARPQ